MSVNRTAQGTYRARVRDRTGRQVVKTFKLKGDAQAWEREQLRLRDEGALVGTSKVTVAEWAETWLVNARSLSAGTVATYRRDLDRYILPRLGEIRLTHLTSSDIDAYLTAEMGDYAASTVHRHYRTIHRMCEVAVRRGLLATNPAHNVDPPKVPRTPMRFLSIPELEAVAGAINPRYRAWVLVAGYGGLRWGEMQALRAEHVDGNAITVVEQLDGASLKTKGSQRRVVLPPSIGAELAAHMATYPGRLVFTNNSGRPINHPSFSGNHWKPALVKAGVDPQTRIHDLRHTAVAIMIQAGAHPKMVADMMGHSTIVLTMDRYGHWFPAMHDDVATRLEALRQAQNGQTNLGHGE